MIPQPDSCHFTPILNSGSQSTGDQIDFTETRFSNQPLRLLDDRESVIWFNGWVKKAASSPLFFNCEVQFMTIVAFFSLRLVETTVVTAD